MSRHSFDPEVAAQVGLNAAVIFQNIAYWCERNAVKGKNVHDGNAWTFNSIATYEGLFPYLSGKQIRAALDKLEQSGLIETGNFNRDGRDRTKWYGLTKGTDAFARLVKCHLPCRADTFAPEGEPLPDSKPDIKQQIENTRDRDDDLFSEMEERHEQSATVPTETQKPRTKVERDFDRFWEAYPRKIEPDAALRNFKKALKSTDAETLIAAASRYADEVRADNRETRFIQKPKNWLSSGAWQGEAGSEAPVAGLSSSRYALGPQWGEVVR